MTKAQFAKLQTILIKLEVLQREVTDRRAKERMDTAKNELMRIEHLTD